MSPHFSKGQLRGGEHEEQERVSQQWSMPLPKPSLNIGSTSGGPGLPTSLGTLTLSSQPLLSPPRLPSALSFCEVSLTTLSLLGDRVSFSEGGTLLPKAKSDLWFQSNGEVIVGNIYVFLNVGLLWLFHLAELLKPSG